ncbi:hypothetical protein AB4259_14780 [Vibrio amylolyticus]|uniref:hypothetical protein n=1 Tax=Vibrio amylolyticus TaxID=2847292 RepID=UPI00355253BA
MSNQASNKTPYDYSLIRITRTGALHNLYRITKRSETSKNTKFKQKQPLKKQAALVTSLPLRSLQGSSCFYSGKRIQSDRLVLCMSIGVTLVTVVVLTIG